MPLESWRTPTPRAVCDLAQRIGVVLVTFRGHAEIE
jgi:hypothetical protein